MKLATRSTASKRSSSGTSLGRSLLQSVREMKAGKVGRVTLVDPVSKDGVVLVLEPSKEKGRSSTKISYSNEQIGKAQVIPDFLPSSSKLMFVKEDMKMNLALSKRSIEFFKAEAKRRRTQFQQVIRELLEANVGARMLVEASSRNAEKTSRSRKSKGTNPEWTSAMVAKALPAREALPRVFGAKRAREMLKPLQKQK